MANLAIKGHATRGKEVIEILEMLGGANLYSKSCSDSNLFCYLSNEKRICELPISESYREITLFTLEEFLEKFPYKVGDRVKTIYGKIGIVSKPIWSNRDNCIRYELEADTDSFYFINELQPYKEETMEKEKKYYDEWLLTDYLEFEDNDDAWADEVEVNLGKDYEIQIRGDKTFIVKKKSQYPKTYEECCKVLLLKPEHATYSVSGLEYERHLIVNLQRLLICRNAYWKIAGEQMGLGKPWKPDFTDTKEMYYIFYKGYIEKGNQRHPDNYILIFPTVEMRDAFYENFKELIELCKELL